MSTENDRLVLNHILSPLFPNGQIEDNNRIETEDFDNEADDLDENVIKAKRLEIEAVSAAEEGKLSHSLELMSKAIQLCPGRPSAYNNRAQAFRLNGNIDAALNDLNMAIDLSGGRGSIACKAFVQRAMIYRLQGRDDDAKKDYESASSLGSEFAKRQLVAMNPYAAMCNRMLTEVMGKLQRGEPTDTVLDHAA